MDASVSLNPKQVSHFHGLNGLRFVAASLVVYHHAEITKADFGFASHWAEEAYRRTGELSVTFFFVLSGFLITFLLLQERERHGRVAVGNFYIRRVLRIWPLYFLIVLLGFIVFPQIQYLHYPVFTDQIFHGFWIKFGLFLGFLPQVAFSAFPPNPYCVQTWSIGVEELFYLFWPLLFLRKKISATPIAGIVFGGVALPVLIRPLLEAAGSDATRVAITNLIVASRFGCMAIGGLAAWLFFHGRGRAIVLLQHPIVSISALGLTTGLWTRGYRFSFADHEIYSMLFAVLIVGVATHPTRRIKLLSHPVPEYLGKISYGIYMFNNVAAIIAIRVMLAFNSEKTLSLLQNTAYNVLVLTLTIGAAAVSYRFYERPFLLLKDRFSPARKPMPSNYDLLPLPESR